MAEAPAIGGGLSLARSGDVLRLDVGRGQCGPLVPEDVVDRRRAAPPFPPTKTPWQGLYSHTLGHLSEGAVTSMEEAVVLHGVAARTRRHEH